MKLGAEPKKMAALAILVVVAAVAFYMNSHSGTTPAAGPRVIPTSTTSAPTTRATAKARQAGRPSVGEFRVRVLGGRPDDPGPEGIDPQLRLDLLAKVEAVEPMEAGRNLFQFGQAPAPPKPIPAVPTNVVKIPVNNTPPPPVTAAVPAGPPPPPPPTPITLKYYGIKVRKSDGRKQAFLQDGDDILFAQENDVIKQKYRIVKIAPGSIDVEDIPGKNTQTLKMQDIPAS